MNKRHLVVPALKQLEADFRNRHKVRMAGVVHQTAQLLDPKTSLSGSQLTETLHLLEVEGDGKRTIVKVVTQIVTMINGLYMTYLVSTCRPKQKR